MNFLQRRRLAYEKKKNRESEGKDNGSQIISTTTIEKISTSTDAKPTKLFASKSFNIHKTSNEVKEEKTEENISSQKISIVKSSKNYEKIEQSSGGDKNSSNKKRFLSSRFQNSKQIENSPKIRNKFVEEEFGKFEKKRVLDKNKSVSNLENYKSESSTIGKGNFFGYSKMKSKSKKDIRKQSSESFKSVRLSEISDSLKACQILEKYTWRTTHIDILDCFKKKINSEIITIHLIKIIKTKEKIIQYILRSYFERWKNNTFKKKSNDLISRMFLKIIKIIIENHQKKLLSKKLYQWMKITQILSGKYYNKEKSIILIKSIIRNLNRKNNEIIIRKYLNRWKKTIEKSSKTFEEASLYLFKINKIKNGKYFLTKLRENKRETIIQKIIIKHGKPRIDMINYYFKRWKFLNKRSELIENANIIQNFCKMKLKNRLVKKRWKKLYSLLKENNTKNDIKYIVKIIKYYKGLEQINSSLKSHTKEEIFNVLKKRKNKKKIIITLTETIEICNIKYYQKLLRKYLYKWRNNIKMSNNKDIILENMMNVLETKRIKNSANYLYDVFLLSKLLKDIQKTRAIYFLRKIREEGKNNDLYTNLSNDLVDTKDDYLYKFKVPIMNKIYRMYAYKVLSNLFKYLERNQKSNIKPNIKDFFKKLYKITIQKSESYYGKELTLETYPKIIKGMKIHLKSRPKLKINQNDGQIIVYRKLAPSLVKYINRIFKLRKFDVFDKIRFNTNGKKFCKLLKSFSKKTQILDKEDLIDNLKYNVYMKYTKKTSSNRLYYLVKKAIIRKILNISKTTGSIGRLLHLVNITLTHRNIKDDRWLLKLIKKWRFITFVKKMALKKMELIYKDLHVTYLEMADNVLNEGAPLGPYGSRFLPDINIDKYLYEFNDPLLMKGSEAYKGVKKQYVFESLDAEYEQRMKTIKEIETIDKVKEINRSYYDYDRKSSSKYSDGKNSSKYSDGKKMKSEGISNVKGKNLSKGEYTYEYGFGDDSLKLFKKEIKKDYINNNNNINNSNENAYYSSSRSYFKGPGFKKYMEKKDEKI